MHPGRSTRDVPGSRERECGPRCAVRAPTLSAPRTGPGARVGGRHRGVSTSRARSDAYECRGQGAPTGVDAEARGRGPLPDVDVARGRKGAGDAATRLWAGGATPDGEDAKPHTWGDGERAMERGQRRISARKRLSPSARGTSARGGRFDSPGELRLGPAAGGCSKYSKGGCCIGRREGPVGARRGFCGRGRAACDEGRWYVLGVRSTVNGASQLGGLMQSAH